MKSADSSELVDKFYTRLHGVTSHYVTIRHRHENVESHYSIFDFYTLNNFPTETFKCFWASGQYVRLRYGALCKPRTLLLLNAYKQTTPWPKKWLACWGTLQRQTDRRTVLLGWLMHKARFIPQRVTVRYAASTDLDVLYLHLVPDVSRVRLLVLGNFHLSLD
jgi:hypothetical protein